MLHLYCVRRRGEPAPDAALRGVEGAAVHLVEGAAGLGAWVSRAEERAAPTAERLRAHDDVVRAALRSATPLPVRYGTALADEAAVRELLDARRADFAAALARVAGQVEMGVSAALSAGPAAAQAPAPDAPAPVSGREYLERRRAALRAEQQHRADLEALLDRVAAALDAELPSVRTLAPPLSGSLAQLVPRGAVAEYRAAFERARAALPDVRLALSGPWAPYSFV